GVSKGEKIEIRLNAEKNIRAEGAIYEIAPQADSVTRTYLVKVAIENFPPQMLLGATVVGSLKLSVPPSIQIPASALTELNGQPAVWRVDATEKTVQLAPVKIERYTTESAVIADGLQSGDIVVTAGVQALHQNQKVKLLDVSHE
ncbi:TPA: efflux transporter periplasmic adaptor subunit, partial [Candidatus Sumerlaeota bacterium]|nr:efflux transporter periplasmic adaptor subunit [Candidatus Sumerlaeota bacterium]